MRLVCPNCKANYEIPRQAVPIGGREVKCDSCGHSWFQTRTKKSTDEQLIEPENKTTKEETEEVASAASNQKKIDPSVIKILREEAKREIEARDQERNKKNIKSENKRSFKNVKNSEPATLTKDALAEALEDKKTTKRSGFIFGLLIVLLALLAYTNSNQLISAFPESEIYIVSYIELIDEIRLELNKLAGKVTYLVTNLI